MNNPPKRPPEGAPQMPPMRGRGPMGPQLHKEKPKNMLKTLGKLFHYIGRSKILVLSLVLIMALVTLFDLAGPALQGEAINTIKIDATTGEVSVDFSAMCAFLSAMGVLFALSAVLALVQGIVAAKLSQRTVYMMRNDLFKKISRLPIQYTDTHQHGDIMSRMTNDVENVSNAIS